MSNEDASNTLSGERFLSFSLGEEEYAMPLLSVREVIAMPEFTAIPYTPPHFLGIMNLRGQVISVIDLRLKFNMKPKPNAETSVIICDLKPFCIGVVVDAINSVLAPKPNEVSQTPKLEGHKQADFVTAVYRREKQLILFLNIAKILGAEDHAALARAQQPVAKAA